LLVGASKRNPKDLPTAEQVLFAALRHQFCPQSFEAA
jgi:hypothetical protein